MPAAPTSAPPAIWMCVAAAELELELAEPVPEAAEPEDSEPEPEPLEPEPPEPDALGDGALVLETRTVVELLMEAVTVALPMVTFCYLSVLAIVILEAVNAYSLDASGKTGWHRVHLRLGGDSSRVCAYVGRGSGLRWLRCLGGGHAGDDAIRVGLRRVQSLQVGVRVRGRAHGLVEESASRPWFLEW